MDATTSLRPAPQPGSSPGGTRERLLDAARSIVEERGYGGASVLAIADKAGVAAGTLYRHFASKEELFVELFRIACDREIEAMRGSADQMPAGAPATLTVVEVLQTFAQRALRRPRLAWALLAEPVDQLVDVERILYRQRYSGLIADLLAAAVAAGEIPEQDTAFTAAALVRGCSEVLIGPLSRAADPSAEPAELLDSLRLFTMRSIGSQP